MLADNLDIPSTNPAFVLHGIRDVRFEDHPIPTAVPKPTDVIVAPKKTGICGSDVHYLKHGAIGDFVLKDPMILGHESSAVVVKVGHAVKNLKPGDRVALEPGESCRLCFSCKSGFYNQCPDMVFAATPPYQYGTLAGFYTLPADLCHKLPDSVSMSEGAMIEPLSVGVHALYTVAQMRPASNVVIFGAGPVGLLTMAVAKGLGARFVLAVDIQESRLQFAKEYAASDYFLSSKPQENESKYDYARRQADEIKAKFGFEERGPGGVDVIVDCSGAEVCINTAIHLLKHGGTLVQVGMGNPDVSIPITTLLTKELTMKGSFRYNTGNYDVAIDLVARGLVKLEPLITHRYTFKQAIEAFEANETGNGADGKPVIKALIDGPL